jgi:putative Mg2+ transporter-C (MgtC) family protein
VIDALDITFRVSVATLAGAAVGWERESHGREAGMRTHALVAAGACMFTLVGAYGFPELTRGPNVDPMRVAAQVVSGIGFVGGGVIIRERGAIRGVTTAAALWASAALGMAAGASMPIAAAVGLGAILFTLIGLRTVRERLLRPLTHDRQTISISYRRGQGTLGPLVEAVENGGGRLENLSIDDDDELRHVALEVRTRDAEALRKRIGAFSELPEVDAVSCQ